MSIKIPIEAKIDTADVSQATAKLVAQINAVGKAVAEANKVKFNPITTASVEDLKKMRAQYESLQKISGAFNSKLKATGQKGTDFFELDWQKMHPDARTRARSMRQAFEYVTGHSFVTPTPSGAVPVPPAGPAVPAAPGGAGGSGGHPNPPPGPGGSARKIGRDILSSGLRSAGPVGGVADQAIGIGMSGGIMSGLAGLAGGLAALAVGKAVSSVMGKVGDAEQENIRYDTLKRTLGDVNVGFAMLKESLRQASYELDVSFEEGQRLALEFAKITGAGPDAAKDLAEEVMVNGGFARAFGLDPSQANNFFGQMREMGVTRNVNDSRALALMIGEAIDKSGTFAKADEVLAAIANYTQQQTRLGLTAANASGYSGMLTGLISQNIPGLDPQSAAALLSRVNSAVQSGGAAGEAGQHFTYTAIATELGLNPVQAKLLQEQGAFGTGAEAFKKGGVADRFYGMFGGSSPGTASGSSRTNLEMLLAKFKEQFAGRPDLMANAMSNYFGIGTSQAMALAITDPADLNGVLGRLSRQGVDIGKVSGTGIETLARVNSGDADVLAEIEKGLRARTGDERLTRDEERRLDEAIASQDQEQMRDVLAELVATREQEKTTGSEIRAGLADLGNLYQEGADKLVEPINDIRTGVLLMAGKGEMGTMGIRTKMAEVESDERLASIKSDYGERIKDAQARAKEAQDKSAELRRLMDTEAKAGRWLARPKEEREAIQKEVEAQDQAARDALAEASALATQQGQLIGKEEARLKEEKARIRTEFSRSGSPTTVMQEAVHALEGMGWSREQAVGIVANLQAESGMDPTAVGDGGRAIGMAQWHPDRQAKFKELFGIDVKDATREQQLAFVDWELRNTEKVAGARLRAAKTAEEASTVVQRYYERPNQADDVTNRARREEIAGNLYESMKDSHATPLPGGLARAKGGSGSDTINLHVTGVMNNADGSPAGIIQPATISTAPGRPPTPSGVRP